MEEEIKTIEFGEDQLNDLHSVMQAMLFDSDDPRSSNYVRKLVRPPVSWLKVSCYVLLPLIVLAILGLLGRDLGLPTHGCIIGAAVLWMGFLALTAKGAVLYAIRIYQRYAPASLRERCRFEPSCSEYMRMAIEKYGLIKGVKKGRNRLKRCNVEDGGYDYP